MHPKSPTWLFDTAHASASVLDWTANVTMADYENDSLLRAAVERGVGTVGTALLHLDRTDPATAACLPDHQAVVGLRDRLLYHYDDIDHRQLWDITRNVLPALRTQAEDLLRGAEIDQQEPTAHSIAPIKQHLDAIRALCQEYGVARLELFDSAATDAFNPARSDIDFVVDYAPDTDLGPWQKRYFEFKERLETLLGRPVDLVMAGAMRNPYLIRSVNETRRLLYAA